VGRAGSGGDFSGCGIFYLGPISALLGSSVVVMAFFFEYRTGDCRDDQRPGFGRSRSVVGEKV